MDAFSEWVRDGMTSDQWTLYKRFGFKDPPPGLVYKDLETIDVDISFDQMTKAKTVHPLRSISLVVISKGLPFDLSPWQPLPADFPGALESAWKAAQEKLAALVPNARHIVATKSSHYVQIEQPALVIEAVRQVIGAVRAPQQFLRRALPITVSEQGPINAAKLPAVLIGASGERGPAPAGPGLGFSNLSLLTGRRYAGHRTQAGRSKPVSSVCNAACGIDLTARRGSAIFCST